MTTATKAKILRYDVIFEEAREGGYMAIVPSLAGCVSEGDTLEEAKENVQEAILAYLESLAKDGENIPLSGKSLLGSVEVNFQNA